MIGELDEVVVAIDLSDGPLLEEEVDQETDGHVRVGDPEIEEA